MLSSLLLQNINQLPHKAIARAKMSFILEIVLSVAEMFMIRKEPELRLYRILNSPLVASFVCSGYLGSLHRSESKFVRKSKHSSRRHDPSGLR